MVRGSGEGAAVAGQAGAGGIQHGGPAAAHGAAAAASGGAGGTVAADARGEGADQRREQMLRAAIEVISERGFAATRIADVAERAGASPALVIYYFKTKDQLLADAMRYSEDTWYAESQRRLAGLPGAAARLEEIVAMCCLPESDPQPGRTWPILLDVWALAARNSEVAGVRQKDDERWREIIRSLVVAGQEAGEFCDVDATAFTMTLSAMLDGLAIQIALQDPFFDPRTAFELAMRFASGQLRFDWAPSTRDIP
jgi:AcrR family transcriptional regulator